MYCFCCYGQVVGFSAVAVAEYRFCDRTIMARRHGRPEFILEFPVEHIELLAPFSPTKVFKGGRMINGFGSYLLRVCFRYRSARWCRILSGGFCFLN
jgi:hypothetical protein